MLDFGALQKSAEDEQRDKKFKIDDARKKRSSRKRKRELVIQGQEDKIVTPYTGPATKVFEAQSFFIMTEALKPLKKSKAEIEALVKANGGNVVASEDSSETLCVADRNLVKVASVQKRGERTILRPQYLYDRVAQSEKDGPKEGIYALPIEMDRHVYFVPNADEKAIYESNVDEFGDSYARDLDTAELRRLFDKLDDAAEEPADGLAALRAMGAMEEMPGFMFEGLIACFAVEDEKALRIWRFARGSIADSIEDVALTHVVVAAAGTRADELRRQVAGRRRLPRVVSKEWIVESWRESTRLDEERFVV